MTKLRELCHEVAVCVGKASNMRVTASAKATAIAEYLVTDEGIADCVAEGLPEFTLKCVFEEIVVKDTAYPQEFGSFRSFERLLQIGGDPSMDAQIRARQAADDKGRLASRKVAVRNSARVGRVFLQDPEPPVALSDDDFIGVAPEPNPIILTWTDFPNRQIEFIDWLRDQEFEIVEPPQKRHGY